MSRTRSQRWLLAAALVSALVVPVFALATSSREALRQADRNGDSTVDRAEFYQRMVDLFYQLDVDRDGALTRVELEVDVEALRAADTDGNGTISLDEFQNDRFKDFRSADSDRDGVLSLEEIEAW